MTSSVCPDGAYVLKKQTDDESSLSIGRNAPTNEGESPQTTTVPSTPPPRTSPGTSKGPPARSSEGTGDASAQLVRPSIPSSDKFTQPAGTSAVSKEASGQPAPPSASESRPPRAGA